MEGGCACHDAFPVTAGTCSKILQVVVSRAGASISSLVASRKKSYSLRCLCHCTEGLPVGSVVKISVIERSWTATFVFGLPEVPCKLQSMRAAHSALKQIWHRGHSETPHAYGFVTEIVACGSIEENLIILVQTMQH